MPFDRSWRAVFRPWENDDGYFAALPRVRPSARAEFDRPTAYACAELSRLAYQPDAERRRRALEPVGLRELGVVRVGSTVCLAVRAERAVVAAFRGTMEPENWRTNFDGLPLPWGPHGRVHAGFRAALERIWPALLPHLGGDTPLVYTGHSLGGALAALSSVLRPAAVTYTFGAPRVGTRSFVRGVADASVHRVVHGADVVPTLPPSAVGYRHAGRLWYIDPVGALHDAPPRLRVYAARISTVRDIRDLREEAPPALADHAPAGYVARLAALLGEAPT